jgi:hypothetical protein
MKRNNFLTAMLGVLLALGMAGCDEGLATGAQKALEGMASYSIVLGGVDDGSSYTAVVYDKTEAVGSGEAPSVNGSASIKLTPYNGKPPFSERAYRVWISCGTTVKEAPSVAFVAGGNTQLDWSKMTLIKGDGGSAASGLNISFSGGVPDMTYYIEVYDTSGEEIYSLADLYDYEYPLIAAGALPDGAGTLPDAPPLTGKYYVVIDDEDFLETRGGLVPFDNGNANFDLSSLTSLLDGGGKTAIEAKYTILLLGAAKDAVYAAAVYEHKSDGKVLAVGYGSATSTGDAVRIAVKSSALGYTFDSGEYLVTIREFLTDTQQTLRYESAVTFAAGDVILNWSTMTESDSGNTADGSPPIGTYTPVEPDDGDAFTSLASAFAYMDAHADGNTADNPVPLKLNINLSSYTDGWNALISVLANSGKYVALDLSACSIKYTAFDLYQGDVTGKNYIVSLVLPDAATSIVSYSSNNGTYTSASGYYNNSYTKLRTVSGSNVVNIGGYAFKGCKSITTVSFPKATTIGESVFYDCTSLTTVLFPELTSIGSAFSSGAFGGCTSLTSVSFPKVTSIGSYAFSGCTALTTVSLPEVASIREGEFSGCMSLTTVSFPKAISIGYYSFYNCTAMTTVSFPDVTDIGERAFQGCTSLNSTSFPNATSIGANAFSECTSLTEVFFQKVTIIAANTFANHTSLTTVSFPEVTSIGESAFSGCTSLTTVSFPNATTISGNYAFNGCTSLTTVSFPKATSIGNGAFHSCASLTTVSFPEATSIGNSAFWGCTALTTLDFPKLTSIGKQAFDGCTSLVTVSFPKATTIGENAFYQCTALTTVSFPEVTTIGNGAFSYCTALTTVSFPEATSIGQSAFYGCIALTTVDFPEATSIWDGAFMLCTSLTTVSIPKATTIEYGAFKASGTTPLTITMGNAAPSVGMNMFYEITGVKNVTVRVPSGATGYTSAWQTAFKGWNNNINLVVEDY